MPATHEPSYLVPEAVVAFDEGARQAVYDVIALRRDVRHFEPGRALDRAVLRRILEAAHMAPSVGFSQPWGFVVVRDEAQRARIRESFLRCRQAEAARFPEGRREQYLSYRLEGILEASLNVCVAVDLRPRGEAILGTIVQPEAVRASACCAVQNLWLAARAEGVGVGWVSIVEPAVLRAELRLPPGVEPIAYLCLGHPVAFRRRPMLEESGWRERRAVDEVVHEHGIWQDREDAATPAAGRASEPPRSSLRTTAIPPLDAAAMGASRAHQATLGLPAGSLGRLEQLAAWWAGVRGELPLPLPAPGLAVFCADHGVVAEGVSAHPSAATTARLADVMAGGAAVSALAARHGVRLVAVDVGLAGDLSALPCAPVVPLVPRVVRRGTGNLRREPAMTRDEAARAMEAGAETARALAAEGVTLAGLGNLGIGNTTAATAILCALTGAPPASLAGPGAGLDAEGVARKAGVVAGALALHAPDPTDPLDVLAKVGGLEIAAMAGFALEAARLRVGVVVDGLTACAAALCAARMAPTLRPWLLAAHRAAEPAAALALTELGLEPLFDLGLWAGEGIGAVLGLHLVGACVSTASGLDPRRELARGSGAHGVVPPGSVSGAGSL
ncbi:nicotinate-nucleotide--dimethylbenzimidazole phosphoribosyltransferase [Sorangium cellulosum So ce56]|uniref:Nicotinate-nucleotide--dimethylbenzimidazole phosphoribosyltransferase n=1 Tax=Sorangium cellulosum (strain So ce56) TaxID=448385 RepID=A9FKD3_SORC5|nr:nicotinate-nucleotide--dimethylbenzimidazole phosphoribosyltransferase [Sorangium cellulosum]CAN95106.1 nicotinate-nucleotide--dimethylbenzimidazole phosphoribosyltransferase [Sorangium cellulosum So ce56]